MSSLNQRPTIVYYNRCATRILIPVEDWEMPGRFKSPVLFVTGMIGVANNYLLSYGPADEKVGLCWLNRDALLEHIRQFDSIGRLKN
jgi:predicted GH43/DUF377 family glycosyl hydrolase